MKCTQWYEPLGPLGDCVLLLYILENIGRRDQQTHQVNSHPLMSEIHALFDLEFVVLSNTITKEVRNLWDIHLAMKGDHFVTSLDIFFRKYYDLNSEICKPLQTNVDTAEKSDITLVQFDGRTNRRRRVAMSPIEQSHVIDELTEPPVAAIGGPDTKTYLGPKFEYRLGPLPKIIAELLGCRRFVGCDSGISHLAGALGINSTVIIAHTSKELSSVYQLYHNTKAYRLT